MTFYLLNGSIVCIVLNVDYVMNVACNYVMVFFIWVSFDEHSRLTGQQGKREGIYLTPLYHLHPLHRHLDISRAIKVESTPLHIASSRTQTGNLWFPSASREQSKIDILPNLIKEKY